RLEDGVPGVVVNVATRRDADATDAGGQGVANVIAIEVHRGDNVVLGRAEQNLLQEGVGDHILDGDRLTRLRLEGAPWPAVELSGAKVVLGTLVAPIAEGPLGELHDVPLVDQ